MLAKTTPEIQRELKNLKREKHEQELSDWIDHQSRHSYIVEHEHTNPGNVDRQIGQPLTHTAFELRLGKILPPNVAIIENPHRKGFRAVVKILPDGTRETICPYKGGLIPEHSVLRVREEMVRDMSQKTIERKDLPKHEVIPGMGVVFDPGAPRPGWKKIYHLLGEDPDGHRGWRTILIRLVQAGILTPGQIESVFGSDNRQTWAVGMGKRAEALPY